MLSLEKLSEFQINSWRKAASVAEEHFLEKLKGENLRLTTELSQLRGRGFVLEKDEKCSCTDPEIEPHGIVCTFCAYKTVLAALEAAQKKVVKLEAEIERLGAMLVGYDDMAMAVDYNKGLVELNQARVRELEAKVLLLRNKDE
mgnify:CR=1 FL=1